jgi:hypothetical protein
MSTIMTGRWRALAAALLPIVALAGCGGRREAAPPARQVPLIIVAEDISGSAFKRNASLTPGVLERALDEASARDGRVLLVAITGDTVGTRQIPISGRDGDFSVRPEWASTPVLERTWKAQKRSAAMRRYTYWRSQAKAMVDSDYLGLLLLIDDLIAAARTNDARIWIVGDGFQHTREWTLEPRRDQRAACRAKALGFREAGDLGQLHGAQVLFHGGGMRNGRGAAAQQAALRGCWEEIVHAAGGITPPGWWDGILAS